MITPTFAALLAALAVAQAAPAPISPEPLARTDIPVALVLSGGVSLGSYEAGLSWAVVRFSRAASAHAAEAGAPRLVAITGASAGSVNALLSGVLWCTDPAPGEDAVDHNLLHDLWTAVGLEALLPDRQEGYLAGDGLLSTRPLLDEFARFERRIEAQAAARRFRPGCRIPIGATVTRTAAAEHDTAGLALRTQRFALPWRVEVGPGGRARVIAQRLGDADARPDVLDLAIRDGSEPGALTWPQVMQGMLASAAFPLAFRPRELCDCSARCPLPNQVRTGTCEGPRGPITNLSCPARSPQGEPLTLCSHAYVDGGIFDNTPVGLGDELTRSLATTHPLQPVTYVYIDPDLRRLRPTSAEGDRPRAARPLALNIEETARLASELVATARTENLSHTLQSGPWNVTTRGLLYETAASLLSFAAVQRRAAAALGRSPAGDDPPPGRLPASPAVHAALGRALLRCYTTRPRGPGAVRACASGIANAEAGRAPDEHGAAVSEGDVLRLADAMRSAAAEALRDHAAAGTGDADEFAQEMRTAARGMAFLADETTRVARGATPDARVKQFRAALLDTIQLGRALSVQVAHLANAAVLEQLRALRSDPLAGAAAAQASAAIAAAPDVLFVPDELGPTLQALDRAAVPGAAVRALRELARVGPMLEAEIVRLNRLARSAEALQHERSERAVTLSSRFAPITGSHLGYFGAFLDRPFREYDYHAGVYDASHAIAVSLCEAGAVAAAPRPVRAVGAAAALDLRAPDTQRCLGLALETVRRELDLDRSGTAVHVFRMLARAELEASLGEAAARRLELDPAWSWLSAAPAHAPDARVATVADALLSARVACDPETPAPCLREMRFEELLSALRARSYQPVDREMRALFEDPDAWARRTVRRLVDRSYDRELASPSSPDLAHAVLMAHGLGEMWLRGPGSAGAGRLALDASTIPSGAAMPALDARRWAAHLLPYRLELDVARGGISASWFDPSLSLGAHAALVAEITPISYEAAHGRASSSLALVPKLRAAGLSVGAGPKGSLRWNDRGTMAGALVRLSAFQERLSLSVGTDGFAARDRDLFVTIGVSDLNGAFFWLMGR